MNNKGTVAVEFALLITFLVAPVYFVAIAIAPNLHSWAVDLRATIVEGQALLEALEALL